MSRLDNSLLQFTTFSWQDFAARTHVESIQSLIVISRGGNKIRKGAPWREQETYSLWRSAIKHWETRRDETERTTDTVFIFVNNLSDQSTDMERHTRRREEWLQLLQNLEADDRTLYDIKVILEKTMEQLNGESCYRCFIPTSLKWRRGRSKHGWITWRKEAKRKYFTIAQTLMVTFFTCVLFKATLAETKLISAGQCGNPVQLGWIQLSRWFFPWLYIGNLNQVWVQKGKNQNKDGKAHSSPQWIPWTNKNETNLTTWQHHGRYCTGRGGKCTRSQYLGSTWKVLKTEN